MMKKLHMKLTRNYLILPKVMACKGMKMYGNAVMRGLIPF